MSLELELKFLLAPSSAKFETVLPLLGHCVNNTRMQLLNAYFDTADNWFRQHDIGLRTRQKNGQTEQTIKLAGQQHGALQLRPEYNIPVASVWPDLNTFPEHIWPQGSCLPQLQQQLTEIFRTDFQRQSWHFQLADNTEIELVYDLGEISANGQRQLISELELELLSGSEQQLFRLAAILIQHLPLCTGWLSKAARGYMLAQGKLLTTADLPLEADLAALMRCLQQNEACYQQSIAHQTSVAAQAIANAVLALQTLGQLLTDLTFSVQAEIALSLAQQLAQNPAIFSSKEYNLLLLVLSEYLLTGQIRHS